MDELVARALREVVAVRAALDVLETTLVVRARRDGAAWSELAKPLGLSKQGVRKRHLASDPVCARRRARPQTIEEYYAEMRSSLAARGITLP